MPLVVQIVPTRDKGGTTKTRGTTVTREVVTKATKEVVEVRRGEDTTPMRTKTRVVDPVAGVIVTTLHRETTLLLPPAQVRIKVGTFVLIYVAAVFDDNTHNLMDVHVEEQPHVIVREEFLHDPSILPSHQLNVTVIVQDKEKTCLAKELRAVGKAVLDTANYSEDCISFTLLEKLNATHLCYPVLKAITVYSGLDGQCYLNNEICDSKILFQSYDAECQSISLPMRVNRKTEI